MWKLLKEIVITNWKLKVEGRVKWHAVFPEIKRKATFPQYRLGCGNDDDDDDDKCYNVQLIK